MRMSWQDSVHVIPRIAETEAEALSITGLSEFGAQAAGLLEDSILGYTRQD